VFRHGRLILEDKPFVEFASIDRQVGRSMKFRISKIVSTFMAEVLEIGVTLEIVEKIDSEQNLRISRTRKEC
jgi:hypothetical protein